MRPLETIRAALPDADVRLFDYDLSVGIERDGKAWVGDAHEGFDINDEQQVADLINLARTPNV